MHGLNSIAIELTYREDVLRSRTSNHCTPLPRTGQGVSHHSEIVCIDTRVKTTNTERDIIRDLHSNVRQHTAFTTSNSNGVVQNTLNSV